MYNIRHVIGHYVQLDSPSPTVVSLCIYKHITTIVFS